jgi:hypothetical protein
MADLSLYDFDIVFKDAKVPAGERSLGNCRKLSAGSDKYLCPFQIGPAIKLPDSPEYVVTNSSEQTELPAISLGSSNITLYVKYAGDLERKAISKLDGTITITPKKTDSMINAEKMREKMAKSFSSFQKIFKTIITMLSFCAVCKAGNTIVDTAESAIEGIGKDECKPACVSPQICNSGKCEAPSTGQPQSKSYCYVLGTQTGTCGSAPCIGAVLSITAKDGCSQLPENKKSSCESCFASSAGSDFSAGDIITILVAVATVVYTIIALSKLNLFGSADDQKSEITDGMENGMKWGFAVCVMPRIVGELGAWAATKDSKTENAFEGISAFGKGVGKACDILLGFMPLIMGFLQFYLNYLQFEMCMDMVQSQVEMTSQYAGSSSNPAYQAQASTQAGISTMDNMMNCFSKLSNALDSLTNKLVILGQYTSSSLGSTRIIYFYNGNDIGQQRSLGPGTFAVRATNVCRGNSRAYIDITGTGTGCSATRSEIYCSNNNYQNVNNYNQQDLTSSTLDTSKCTNGGNINVLVNAAGTAKQETFTYNDAPPVDETKSGD